MLLAAALLALQSPPAAVAARPEVDAARAQLIAWIEARIVLPPGAAPLESYERLYAERDNGEIVALYRRSDRPGRRWIGYVDLPLVLDGGCAFIDVRVSADPAAPIHAECHGEA